MSVSDVFLTWGWSLNSTHKVVPTGRLKKVPKVPYRESGRLLLTLADFPAYMYDDTAMLIGKRNSLDYLEDQALFFRTLKPELQDRLAARLYHKDRGNFSRKKLETAGLQKFSALNEPLLRQLRGEAMCICTYNSTIFLETLAANYPTVCFWRSRHWPLNQDSIRYYNRLREVGILHESPESAADFINSREGRFSEWWLSTEVQLARETFVANFSRQLDWNYLRVLLRDLANQPEEASQDQM